MRISSAFLIATASIIPAGCTTLQNQSRIDPQTIAIYPQLLATTVDCREPRVPGDTRTGAINVKCLALPTSDGAETLIYNSALKDPIARNRLGSILTKQSDDICTVEMGRLTANEAIVNTTLSTATSVLTTAGSLVTGQTLQSILTGGAAVTNATRDHIRSEVYRNLLTAQVTKAIRLARATYLGQLKGKYGSTLAEYSVDDMIRDVNQYHGICSFYAGLGLVDAAVSRTGSRTVTGHEQLTRAINDLGVRINALNADIATPTTLEATRPGLIAQRDALLAEQTELFKKRAALAASNNDSTTQETPEAAVPGSAPPGNEGEGTVPAGG
jgi:hypothetical protein